MLWPARRIITVILAFILFSAGPGTGLVGPFGQIVATERTTEGGWASFRFHTSQAFGAFAVGRPLTGSAGYGFALFDANDNILWGSSGAFSRDDLDAIVRVQHDGFVVEQRVLDDGPYWQVVFGFSEFEFRGELTVLIWLSGAVEDVEFSLFGSEPPNVFGTDSGNGAYFLDTSEAISGTSANAHTPLGAGVGIATGVTFDGVAEHELMLMMSGPRVGRFALTTESEEYECLEPARWAGGIVYWLGRMSGDGNPPGVTGCFVDLHAPGPFRATVDTVGFGGPEVGTYLDDERTFVSGAAWVRP